VIITKTVESLDGLGTILPASGKKQTQRQSAAKHRQVSSSQLIGAVLQESKDRVRKAYL
jgi:hypothetical protein